MNRPVKIAIIAGQLVVGGAERQLYLWLKNLDRNRFQPVVLTLHPGHNDHWEKPIQDLNIPLVPIPQQTNRLSRLLKIVQVLRTHQPALIHGWHLFASVYAGISAKLLGVKSLGSIRNAVTSYREHRLESFLTFSTIDGMVVNTLSTSNFIRDKLSRKGIALFTVQNAIADEFKERLAARKKISNAFSVSEKLTWIVTIGRMDPLKRLDLLLEVLASINKKDLPFHCFMIGDGPEKVGLEGKTKALNLIDRVTFTGEIPEANDLLPAFDVFTFTSTDEGMPNVLMEAAAAGLPILSWRYPFSQELLQDQVSGLLIEPGNLNEYASKLDELLENPNLRRKLGNTAREHILSAFSLERYVSAMTEVYETMLSAGNLKRVGER
jgi:glycosyltransferase involved in cell wall biosynthesis